MENISVLKLDSSFKPIEIISWEEAFLLTWLNKAWAVEYSDKWVHSARRTFQVPSVIVLFRYIEEKFFTLPRSKGGKTVWTNVVIACKACNQQKSDLLLSQTPFSLPRAPRKPSYRSIIKKRIKSSNVKWKEYL